MREYTVAVVGAMGAVGTEMLAVLEKTTLPIKEVVPLDIKENQGKTVTFKGCPLTVKTAEKGAFRGVDIALFSAGEGASLALAHVAVSEGATVIDNSNAFRMDPGIPLVVPEVNPQAAQAHQGIIANPNCSTIQMVVALKPIHDIYKIRRIVVSTYQAVSGTGLPAIRELCRQSEDYLQGKAIVPAVYPHQIAFNCLPQIDVFLDNGYSKEEMKMFNETQKILEDPEILVTATAVRVPVFRCHAEAVNVETEQELPSIEEIKELLGRAPGVAVLDDPPHNGYPTAMDCQGEDKVHVGRLRKDYTLPHGLWMWIVADNLRKGAALNAVQIAELLTAKDWVPGKRTAY